jgi:hypothetical protein
MEHEMKIIYEVSERDYGVDSVFGVFENKEIALGLRDAVRAFRKDSDQRIEMVPIRVYEPGDPIFTHVALYVVKEDRYVTNTICPSIYENWGDLEWMRSVCGTTSVGALGRAGTSADHALERLRPQIELLKSEGLIEKQRALLLELAAKRVAEDAEAEVEVEARRQQTLEDLRRGN